MPEAQDDDGDDDEESGKTATFPFLNRLFGSSRPPGGEVRAAPSGQGQETPRAARPTKSASFWTATASTSASGPGTASWTPSSAGRRRSSGWCRS